MPVLLLCIVREPNLTVVNIHLYFIQYLCLIAVVMISNRSNPSAHPRFTDLARFTFVHAMRALCHIKWVIPETNNRSEYKEMFELMMGCQVKTAHKLERTLANGQSLRGFWLISFKYS